MSLMEAVPVERGVEPIIGWRAWYIVGGFPCLRSLTINCYWQPGQPLAVRNLEYLKKHDMGIHAFFNENDAATYVEYSAACPDYRLTRVHGKVYLWGTVVECEKGYRAQYAYPMSLKIERPHFSVRLERDLPGELRARYGCEAEWAS
jgi:hypothetical protein